jgi:hypothetical protein
MRNASLPKQRAVLPRLVPGVFRTRHGERFVVPEDRWIEIQAGSSIFEVWYGKHQLTEVLDSFQLFLAAIIEGRFEETQWTRRGRWIKSIGVLHLATGEVRRSHHANLFPVLLPGFRKREHLVYAPYQ